MPTLTFCKCGGIKGQCECPRYEDNRGTTTERGYGADWQKLSKRFRREHPLCQDCMEAGRTTPAEQVHHQSPFNGVDDPLRLEWSNLIALCEACHVSRHS